MNIDAVATLRSVHNSFWGRWLLANILGWSLGLYVGSFAVDLFGALGLLVGGAVAGVIVGAAQAWAARPHPRWMPYSAAGGTLGAIPAFLVAFTLVFGQSVGLAVMGAVYGLCFGLLQALPWRGELRLLWGVANLLGGGFCAVFAVNGVPFSLPVVCTFGPLAMGAVTGAAYLWIRDKDESA